VIAAKAATYKYNISLKKSERERERERERGTYLRSRESIIVNTNFIDCASE